MRATCSICSDLFDEINAVVSTPCGHTFHELCLLQWLEQSRTCPTCRKFASRKNILKIYFQISDEEEVCNPDTLQNEIQSLKATVKSQEMIKLKLTEEITELRHYVKIAEDKTEEMKEKYFESQTQLTAMKTQMRATSKQTAEIGWLRDENVSLKKQITFLKNIESLVSARQDEVEEILKSCGEGPGALKQMAIYCSLLKKELYLVSDTKQKLSGEVIELRKELGWKASELNQKVNQLKHLNNTLRQLEEENVLLVNKTKTAKMENQDSESNFLLESPAPERLKNKRSTASEDCNTSLVITPIADRFRSKKMKINMISSLVSDRKKLQATQIPIPLASNAFKSQPVTNHENEDDHIRTGYNGLGGHSRFIQRLQRVTTKSSIQKKKSVIHKCKTTDSLVSL